MPALEYLFKFLNAYDFASESTDDVQEENKTLINASVLGKVFEKINGYKDGSVFTPGFITMYMCRQAIRMAVVQKFKEKYGWKIEDFGDLINYIADKRSKKDVLEFNALINSLHICDPAVGSGHFLVSALNELIAIKSELGVLADSMGVRLNCSVKIENDELYTFVDHGKEESFMEYKVSSKGIPEQIQIIQETIFHEKQAIIENCLFGVDINLAEFTHFLSGNTYDKLYKVLRNPLSYGKDDGEKAKKNKIKDLEFIKTYFVNLGLTDIVNQIERDIKSS